VVSLYLNSGPAKPDQTLKAVALRVKAALQDVEVPGVVVGKVLEKLAELPRGRTQIVVAGGDFVESWSVQVELPLVDGLEVRYGPLYLAPLLYALDEFERFGVVLIGPDKARLFEVFMGEVEELPGAFQMYDSREWKHLTAGSVGRRSSTPLRMRSGGGNDKDHYQARLEAWSQRFYKRLEQELEEWAEVRGINRLVLLGAASDTEALASALPRALHERVAARLPGSLKHTSVASVLRAVAPEIARYECQREKALVKSVAEAGVGGPDQVLQLLQQGRLRTVVAPWRTRLEVYQSQDGSVFPSQAQAPRHNQAVKAVMLKHVLPELAIAKRTRLAFVRGEAEAQLVEQFGGLGGLERY
jgi:hypothetical protein